MESNQPVASAPKSSEDKTVAIVAYLSLIGFVVALIIHNQPGKKTNLGAFHLRQGLGIMLCSICMSIIMIIPFIGWVVGCVGYIIVLVMWVMGLISAVNGEMKPAPIMGASFQKWFAGTFN